MAGKNINLYLMDGNPNGRIKCTFANWTGVVYKIPRTDLDRCRERSDLKQSGVYFLFGVSEQSGEPVVYIGQAGARKNGEGVLNRLYEHRRNSEKDYWTEAVVITTSNDSFGPTEISYLENKFCNLALDAKRYEVKNGNDPNPGHITEEKQSELEEFVGYAKIVMGVLGHKVFEPVVSRSSSGTEQTEELGDNERIYYLKRTIKSCGITVEARAKQTQEGFVVLRGSTLCPVGNDTVPNNIKKRIKKRRMAARTDEHNTLLEDVLFSSPSGAAVFVVGSSVNGWTAWKDAEGRTLHDLEDQS